MSSRRKGAAPAKGPATQAPAQDPAPPQRLTRSHGARFINLAQMKSEASSFGTLPRFQQLRSLLARLALFARAGALGLPQWERIADMICVGATCAPDQTRELRAEAARLVGAPQPAAEVCVVANRATEPKIDIQARTSPEHACAHPHTHSETLNTLAHHSLVPPRAVHPLGRGVRGLGTTRRSTRARSRTQTRLRAT
jgi:hypothetical protein